ncbi:MAG: TIGR03960 family B12-binding radical SAM protein [Deltaproteobacteria bacterium]|nr:TIGR03960 family B12-binding radical SAM protein [Deltaproteobacteria bacterium]
MISKKLVQKAKAILEKERGAIQKPWGGRISICLLYPNSYHVGMSNLGFQTVYQRFNSEDDIVCERAFLPDSEDLQDYWRTKTPLISLESQKPLSDFDLLAFSVSFENDFLNILTLLDLARIPLERHLRRGKGPLIIAGGVAVFLNPEPLNEFFDLFVLGEAEELIGQFLEVYRESGRKREDLLRGLAGIEGVYVPEFYHVTYVEDGKIRAIEPEAGLDRKIKRRWISKLDQFPAQSCLFTRNTELKEMTLVEVNRGCPRGCRFCAACFVYHPYRNRSLSLLESISLKGLSEEGRIGLAGTAISDYPHLLSLCEDIVSHGGGVSLASLRVDAIMPSLIDCLKRGGVQAATIAPEAGSERLRKVIKKDYRDEEILRAVQELVENGLSQIKSYFLIGLPSETDEEVKGILSLAKRIEHQIVSGCAGEKKRWKLVLSVNPFVPKPATPFQWVPFEEVGELKRKLKILKNGVKGEKRIELIYDLPKWAYIQALLSRGDRRMGKVLMAAHRHQGNWGQALQETSLNPDFFVHRRRDLDEIFPWDFIDHGIPKEKLKEEYVAAMKEAGTKI